MHAMVTSDTPCSTREQAGLHFSAYHKRNDSDPHVSARRVPDTHTEIHYTSAYNGRFPIRDRPAAPLATTVWPANHGRPPA